MNPIAHRDQSGMLQAGRVQAGERQDLLLVMSVVALLSLGVVMVYSATIASDSSTLDINYGQLIRHLAHISLGGALLYVCSRIPMDWLQAFAKPSLLAGLVMLVLLLFPGVGVEVNGSLRWFDFGGIRLQPSEFVKVVSIIYFADYLARKRDDLHLFKVHWD